VFSTQLTTGLPSFSSTFQLPWRADGFLLFRCAVTAPIVLFIFGIYRFLRKIKHIEILSKMNNFAAQPKEIRFRFLERFKSSKG
jgi:hypothetical protein